MRFLPDFGQKVAPGPGALHIISSVHADPALVDHLARTTGLAEAEARRVVEDVLDFYAEPVEDYVRRRHAHLQAYGARNPDIFAQITQELRDRLVLPQQLSLRQLRRIVYG